MIAVKEIWFGNYRYKPGDILPANTGNEAAWLEAGSAVEDEEYKALKAKETHVKAKRAAKKAGRPGKAVNSESDENLVGQVPLSERRKKDGNRL